MKLLQSEEEEPLLRLCAPVGLGSNEGELEYDEPSISSDINNISSPENPDNCHPIFEPENPSQ